MWSFTAEKGKDLENEKNISFAVTVPKNKDKEFSGEIKVVNNNNVDDYDTVPVRIHTSSSKDLIKFFSEFLIQNLPFLKYFLLNSYI